MPKLLTPLAKRDHRDACMPGQLLQGLLRGAARRRVAQHLQRFVLTQEDEKDVKARGQSAPRLLANSTPDVRRCLPADE
jgi:hypothetical protein